MTKLPTEPIIEVAPLSYEWRLDARPLERIELVVIHCTELPDLAMARQYGERIHYPESGTGNSGHYYVDRDGTVHRFVAPERVAHHTAGHNRDSIGIELVNRGRYPHWHRTDHQRMEEPYPEPQIDALLALLAHLREALPNLERIAGHEDLDRRLVPASDAPGRMVRRKVDPGPLFPWDRVLAGAGLRRQSGDR